MNYDSNDTANNDSLLTSYAPFSVVSPKIRFKTAFITHEEVELTYARYFWNGAREDVRAEGFHKGIPADRNALMLSVNMWW